jgi:steroid delta-isomerase-like uncharacterized protein
MAREETKETFKQIFGEVFEKKNVDALDKYVADDFVDRSPPPGAPTDKEAFKAQLRTWLEAFPDLTPKLEAVMAEGEKVVGRFQFSGTHTGAFFGFPPTGKRFETLGMEAYRFEDGKIAERWMWRDEMAIIGQLGLMQMPG